MNKLVRGKTSLIIVSVAMIFISLLCTAGSVGLIIWGANLVKTSIIWAIILMAIGSIFALTFLTGVIYGFILYFTGKSLVAMNGSVAEDNLAMGTVNMIKCASCGNAVKTDEKFCSKCGKSLSKTKKCPKCEKEVDVNAEVCSNCGEKLN